MNAKSGYCPKCNAEIVLAEEDGLFYIYCPNCGPIPELAEVTELSDDHLLGFPSTDGNATARREKWMKFM